MTKDDIAKRLIDNDALFNKIHVIQQNFNILPDDKEHIGACIKYQDLSEMRTEFISELVDSVVDWVYSSEKYEALVSSTMGMGKTRASANSAIISKAKQKFRTAGSQLLIQGQLGELLLFHFIQRHFKAAPLLRKMPITTSPAHERFGADAIHYKVDGNRNILILGEAKTYTSAYKFNAAFEDALNSILDTYEKHRREMNLYLHEDFLDKEMDKVAESYLNGTIENAEIHLVSIITYNETDKIKVTNQADIMAQIEAIIKRRYSSFDNAKIDIKSKPILNRITYIAFPVWELDELAQAFQDLL